MPSGCRIVWAAPMAHRKRADSVCGLQPELLDDSGSRRRSYRTMEDNRLHLLRALFREAVNLERNPGAGRVTLSKLLMRFPDRALFPRGAEMLTLRDGAAVVDRFNAALGMHRGVREVSASSDVSIVDLGQHGQEGLERLFSTIVPHHPTLEEISLGRAVPGRLAKLLIRALETRGKTTTTTSPAAVPTLRCLELDGHLPSLAEDLATMLRNNAPVGSLRIRQNDRILASEFKLICDALTTNKNLRSLEMYSTGYEARRNATQFSLDDFLGAMEALRTNSTLEEMNLIVPYGTSMEMRDLTHWVPHVENLLLRYNYTLHRLRGFDRHPRIEERLRENVRVREAVAGLQRTRYRLGPRAAWPDALGRVSSKPDLVYKFLRVGNCDAVALHLSGDDGRGQP
jgi:hypothetical protein